MVERVRSAPLRYLLITGAAVALAGLAFTAWRVVAYLESGQAISSTSGLVVFDVDAELAQYPPFVPTLEVHLVGVGIVVILLAVFLSAWTYRRSSAANRASTTPSNADAHTR